MKVLVIGQFIEPPFSEGVVNMILNWSKAVHGAGADVRMLSISSKYSGYHKIFDINFEYVKTERPRFQGSLVDLFSLQKEVVKQVDSDIVHFANNADGISSIPMLTVLKVHKNKIVNSYHNNHLVKSTCLFRNLMFDMITVPSKRMFKAFREKKIPPQRMRIIPPCVNDGEFRPRNKVRAREELGLQSNSFLIFTTGHFERGRLLTPLIQVVHELANEGKNVQLLIGWTGHGETGHIKEIFSIVRNNKLVKIIAPTKYINLYYNASDVYVLSAGSDYVIETPLSIIEALSSGTPVISFDVNASSEIVRDGVNGYLIRDGDFGEMKSKLNYLMNNTHLLKEFSTKARNLILSKFSYKMVGEQLLSLYGELTDNK